MMPSLRPEVTSAALAEWGGSRGAMSYSPGGQSHRQERRLKTEDEEKQNRGKINRKEEDPKETQTSLACWGNSSQQLPHSYYPALNLL